MLKKLPFDHHYCKQKSETRRVRTIIFCDLTASVASFIDATKEVVGREALSETNHQNKNHLLLVLSRMNYLSLENTEMGFCKSWVRTGFYRFEPAQEILIKVKAFARAYQTHGY